MNQLYRLLHTPPACLIKTLAGWKETYAIALRPVPTAPGCDPLPARALVHRPAAVCAGGGALAVLRGL